MRITTSLIIAGLIASSLFVGCDNDKVLEPTVPDNVSFALDIQPILTEKCATCHNPTEVPEPDFRVGSAYESLEDLINEGDIIPGDAEGSEFVEMLEGKSADGNTMPPTGPIAPIKIAYIKKWIDEGALNN